MKSMNATGLELELLKDIFAHPEDDLPRLAYADLLMEENIHPARGEFIKLQVEIARKDPIPFLSYKNLKYMERSLVEKYKRAAELLQEAWGDWMIKNTVYAHAMGDWEFRRGFIAKVTLHRVEAFSPSGVIKDMLGIIFNSHPVERVTVKDFSPTRVLHIDPDDDQHRHTFVWRDLPFPWTAYPDQGSIRTEIFKHLKGGTLEVVKEMYRRSPRHKTNERRYSSEGEALDDLSDAFIAYARGL